MSLRVVKKTCVDVCFLVQGMLENNVYFISDGEATMVVDPSSDAEEIMRALDGRELDETAVVVDVTHVVLVTDVGCPACIQADKVFVAGLAAI